MAEFRKWLEENIFEWTKDLIPDDISRINDNPNRQKAMEIADKIIAFIKSPENLYAIYGSVEWDIKKGYGIGERIGIPNLWIKFDNQPNFGRNKDEGHYYGNIISIALPSRTLTSQKNYYIHYPNSYNGLKRYQTSIFPNIAKFLEKPENYNTLTHEIVHLLDSKKTKGKVFRNYPKDDRGELYYRHPSETNAWLQAFLIQIDKMKDKLSWNEILELMKKEHWFQMLDDKLQRKAISRCYNYYKGKL